VATATYTFRVEGMHCGSCALLIDDALEDLPGVRSTLTSDGDRGWMELMSGMLAAYARPGWPPT
jgi:cation transport ATPase